MKEFGKSQYENYFYFNFDEDLQLAQIFDNNKNALRIIELLSVIVGGMPECVSSWISQKDVKEVLSIQKELIELYENDFSKHNGKINAGRILFNQLF